MTALSLLRRTTLVLATAVTVATASAAGSAWAQFPTTNVVVPVPIPVPHAPAIMLHVNPTITPPDQQRPVQKPFTFFGLLPTTSTGVCAQITSSYLAVMESSQSFRVFTFGNGYNPPPDVVAGRQVKVTYKTLDNGLLQVTNVHIVGERDVKVDAHGAVPSASASVPNIDVKPMNGAPNP